jgi:Bacteriophage tail sheath protein
MPVQVSYPGVYIEEIPSGVHTITGVATSIAAFVDAFARGPLNQAVQVFSMGDFQKIFGGLSPNSEASYGIQQFFLNGGSQAYVVRVIGANAVTAAIDLQDKPGGSTILRASAGQMVSGKSVNNPGAWGNNLRLDVDYNTTDPTKLFNLAVSEIDPNTGAVLSSESYRNLNMTSGDPSFSVDVVNNASKSIQLSSPSTNRPAATGTIGANLPAAPAIPADKSTCSVAVGGGSPQKITLNLQGATVNDYPTLRPFVEAAIRAAAPNDPNLAQATVQLVGAGTSSNQYFFRILAGRGNNFSPNTTLTFTETGTGLDKLASALGLTAGATVNIQQYSLGGTTAGAQKAVTTPTGFGTGADGGAIDDAALRGVQVNKTGIYALEDADLFNILCIPAAAKLAASAMQSVISAAIAYCDQRRAFMIVDIPQVVQDIAGMQTWMTQNDTLRDKNAAVYFPRVMIPDPLNNGRLRDVAPSGTIAGVYAATDTARGVWKAPAGIDASLRNVSQLVYNPVDAENGVLNPLGINCLRNFPVYGNVSWGARTMEGTDVQASEWKYVPIRRLALFLEESLYRGSKWVVFEPNDEPLWAQIRLNFNAFMQTLFRQGAFQGTTPQQAYFVKCDKETTTPTDQNNGIVNILVGFAPLKPAEFVIIQIQQMAGQTA